MRTSAEAATVRLSQWRKKTTTYGTVNEGGRNNNNNNGNNNSSNNSDINNNINNNGDSYKPTIDTEIVIKQMSPHCSGALYLVSLETAINLAMYTPQYFAHCTLQNLNSTDILNYEKRTTERSWRIFNHQCEFVCLCKWSIDELNHWSSSLMSSSRRTHAQWRSIRPDKSPQHCLANMHANQIVRSCVNQYTQRREP